ncbi:hypothetical protein [Paraclostridium bifermentans]|uniref:hypothetical protein n=1 Tax=Paraclostridium bifermentans TaxID=1490 RepID=UPI00359C7902
MKKYLNAITSLFVAVLLVFSATSTVLAAQPEQDTQLKDADGNLLITGKQYIIEPEHFKNRGLTFEVYNNWDYVLASNKRDDDKMYGTPVQLFIENTNEAEGVEIKTNDKLVIKMVNHNWAGYKYLTFDRTGGFVWLGDKGTSVTLEQGNDNYGIAINAGAFVTKYYDGFGRPTGSLLAKTQASDYTYFHVFPTGQVFSNPNKLWLAIYMRRHSTYTGKAIPGPKPEFLFKAVN